MGLFPLDAPVDVTIAVWEWGAYLGEEGKANGIRAKVSSWRRISPDSLIPHAKASGQYLNSILAKIESHKAGYEEAILLDDKGYVCEGSGENIFVVRDGRDRHAAADGLDPRRHQPQVDHPDRARPRLRGRRARPRARRAVPRRRGVRLRHGRRADAAARDRRPRGRRRDAPGRDHARRSRRRSRTPSRAHASATASGSTRSPAAVRPHRRSRDLRRALRRDPARRDAGPGDDAVRAREDARRPPPGRARRAPRSRPASRPRTPRSSSSSSSSRRRRSTTRRSPRSA